ncbi:Pyridine nucleotide-disulphide oxidoreductase [Nocardioides alpinus]|uniref:Pyridine nucleotide-disulphide oxidoreductase n=1 Tax=Nocardioides alpinus TaxID=748909 RepID=A0A1I0W5Y9_9ACTN|nr:FAD-dependent oxidoreductase [Nocardioides alpinus]SFA84149.1 Pyridine nucleotide-disulphide oxidoreductase [Nocardioides alpinus]
MPHPVIIIGAGPIGLAAAAHAAERGLDFLVLEAGPDAGAAVGEWAHVRLFSSWSELIDPAARRLLEATGWAAPDEATYPTGHDWRSAYLKPLADLLDATRGGAVRYGSRVVGVGRSGRDLMVDPGRDDVPFAVHVDGPSGPERLLGSAVVDASGTWTRPNPLGADGYAALGETEHADRITYGIPDLRDPAVAETYAGKHVAVAGRGASAQGVLIGLARLAEAHPDTHVSWLLRRPSVGDAFGGGDNDQLEQRGKLGQDARAAATGGRVTQVTHFRTESVAAGADGRLTLTSIDGQQVSEVDEVIVVTGFRPDFGFLTEVRLDLDPALGAARVLAEQIHPDHHSCGDVAPHGHRELAQPEAGLYLVGMKSYGRAPSFLAMTGFEQVRSVIAALDGDLEAAGRVELVLPETGVCNGAGAFDAPDAVSDAGGGCCGAPAAEPQLVTLGRTGR